MYFLSQQMMNVTHAKTKKRIVNAKKKSRVTALPTTAGSNTYSLEVFLGAESVL
jgi:hypothetical protein